MVTTEDEDNPTDQLPIHPSAIVRKEVGQFLGPTPGFNIREQSVLAEIHDSKVPEANLAAQTHRELVESLKLLQKVQALAPVPDAIEPLLHHAMTSAYVVSSLPKKNFVDVMTPRLIEAIGGQPESAQAVASSIHDHAVVSRARADQALLQIHQYFKGTGLSMIDRPGTMDPRKEFSTASPLALLVLRP